VGDELLAKQAFGCLFDLAVGFAELDAAGLAARL
jgi:hypothetical protein